MTSSASHSTSSRSKAGLILGLAAGSFLLSTLPSSADENMFGYTYGSDTLPTGKFELYNWTTWRHGKAEGHYDAYDVQFELEYGITDRLQTSTYLTFDGRNQSGLDPAEFKDRSGFNLNGVKQSFKYNYWSVYKDPLGISFYLEPAYSRLSSLTGGRQDEFELETKVILQKNFLDDTLIWAMNITPEFEWEKPKGEGTTPEFIFEVSQGLTYRFAPHWFAGVEMRYRTAYPEYAEQEFQAISMGPCVHYAAQNWWATLTYMPQIWGDPNAAGNHLTLEEQERSEVRLKIGYNF